MSRRKKDPLRPLTDAEHQALAQLSRSQAATAVQVARATMLLAVADGELSYLHRCPVRRAVVGGVAVDDASLRVHDL